MNNLKMKKEKLKISLLEKMVAMKAIAWSVVELKGTVKRLETEKSL